MWGIQVGRLTARGPAQSSCKPWWEEWEQCQTVAGSCTAGQDLSSEPPSSALSLALQDFPHTLTQCPTFGEGQEDKVCRIDPQMPIIGLISSEDRNLLSPPPPAFSAWLGNLDSGRLDLCCLLARRAASQPRQCTWGRSHPLDWKPAQPSPAIHSPSDLPSSCLPARTNCHRLGLEERLAWQRPREQGEAGEGALSAEMGLS